jgi:RHS repeat-associated protein
VLLSKGDGSFTVQTQSIPVGDPASGYWNFGASPPTVKRGYRTSVVADVNGDGMPDIVQLENGRLVQYVRQGGQPDVVKGIFEGTGRNVTALYASMSDANVYHSDPASCAGDLLHLSCATRGLLLTSTLQVSGDTSAQIEQYTYENGLIARGGHGFLGFKKRDIRTITPPFVRTQILSDPGKLTTVQGFAGYFYPFSFKPSEVRVDVDTGQGANGHYFASTTTLYTVTSQGSTAGSMSLNVLPTTISSDTADCPGTGQCTGPVRFLSRTAVQAEYDALGNITHRTEERRTGSDFLPVQSDTVDTVYYPVDTHWLIGLVKERKHRSATLTRSATRTTRFTPDLTAVNPVTNLRTGQLLQVEFEPDGDESTHSFRNFERDERGRLKTIYDTSPGLREVRTTSYLYEDADGVYATTITNPMGHKQRIYRHPGLGLVVATVDANGAVASATYDSFARPLSETEATGESATVTYKAPPATGVDIEINPEGRSTRTFALHIDPLGNEKTLSMSVDATKKLEVTNVLDPSGRLARRETRSTTATTSTLLNTLTPVFDNLNRLLSSCHFVSSDGTNRCTRYDYDGLTTTTTNEAGRVTTTIVDGMGRPSIQRAALQTGTSNSMFSYGPFGLPETQSVDDGSGGTIFAYDVLGRLLSVYRSGAGIRGTTYNAFGDVVSTYKQGNFDDPPSGIISFGRDKLGRVTTVTSAGSSAPNALPGLNRAFYWDQTAEGAPAPNAIGNLVDVVDAGFRTSVHFDYNALGLPSRKTWKVFNASTDRDELYAAGFAYDAQGRLDTLTYPSAPGESAPLAVRYAYDASTGSASSLSDAANPGSPIWSATARNELGQITNESMTFAGPLVTRVTSYFLQDGRTRSASLIGPTITSPGVISRAQLNYTYQHDGRPATFGTSGTAFLGAWTSTFGHDNLGRLTSWQPDTGAPVVSYRYDGSGSLLSRSWSSGALGETVTYGTTVTARTVTTTGSGGPTSTDAYAFDRFGRVWDTPAISARLTDDDQIGSLTEKDSGRIDTLVYDGFGNRLLTLFDAEGSAGTLLTLGDVFELRRDGSGNPSTAESRCRLRAGGRLIGDIVRVGSGARTATFYLEDNVHSVIAEASSAGVVTRRARRDPYGNAFTSAATPYLPGDPTASDPDGSSRLGFGSHERDADWGIVDMLARAYSPRLGRFLSPDPIIANVLDRREHNPFAYARNDPTNLYDPTGLAVGKYTEVGDDEIDITQIIDRPAKGDEAGSVFEGTTFGVAVQEGVDAVLGGDASSANTNTSSSGGTSGGTSSGTSGGTNGATGGIGGGNTGVGTPGGSGPGGQGGGAGPTGTEPGRGGHAPGPLYEGPGGGISAGRSGAGGRGGHGGTEGHSGHDGTSAAAPNKSMDLEWLSSLSTAVEAGGAFEESFGKKAQNQKMADFGSKAGKVGSKSGVVTAVVKIIDGVRSGNEDAVNDGLASLTASIIAPIIAAKSGGKIGPSGEFLLEQAIEKGAKRIFDNIKVVDPNPNFWRYGQDITHSADPREVF